MFQPKVLSPSPDPWFVRELRRIDPDLRVSFGYNRYFKNEWAIERRIPPERYFLMYESILTSGRPRIVQQPIFDTKQPLFDEAGEFVSYAQVGVREFDLAPEYEWLGFYKRLDMEALTEIKRAYAWNKTHPLTRQRIEEEEEERKREALRKERTSIGMEGVDEAFRKHRKKVVFGYGDTRNE